MKANSPEIFLLSPDDLAHCPYDGSRMDLLEQHSTWTIEECLHCGKIFQFEIDEEQLYEL